MDDVSVRLHSEPASALAHRTLLIPMATPSSLAQAWPVLPRLRHLPLSSDLPTRPSTCTHLVRGCVPCCGSCGLVLSTALRAGERGALCVRVRRERGRERGKLNRTPRVQLRVFASRLALTCFCFPMQRVTLITDVVCHSTIESSCWSRDIQG